MPLEMNNLCNDLINNITLEILISGYLQSGPEWSKMRTVAPPYSKLYFILGGDAFIVCGGKRTELRPGKAYLIPSGLVYDNGCISGIHFLYFNIKLLNGRGKDLLSAYGRTLECDFPASKTFAMIQKYMSSSPIDSISLKADILSSIIELLATAPEFKFKTNDYSQCVCRALEYIDSNLSIELKVDDICKNVYAARSTLMKKFSNEVGVSIGAYITNEVLVRCEQLLCDTDLSISEISEQFGFCDQFYFSRVFKDKFGETPQKYRKNRVI